MPAPTIPSDPEIAFARRPFTTCRHGVGKQIIRAMLCAAIGLGARSNAEIAPGKSPARETGDSPRQASVIRSATGLLFQSDGSLTGWENAGSWSSAGDPAFCVFDPLPMAVLSSVPSAEDSCRQGTLYTESATAWYLTYDSWRFPATNFQHLAISTDRGLTWARSGGYSEGTAKVDGGNWAGGTATGWIERRGSTYYRHRVVSDTPGGAPNTGLGFPPYYWDWWSASSITGTWTAGARIAYAAGTWMAQEAQPGSVYHDGSAYHMFATGKSGGRLNSGRAAAPAPQGPWTAIGSAICDNSTPGFGGRAPENPKVFYHPALARYICLQNLIAVDGTHTDRNAAGMTLNLADWSEAKWRQTQAVCPMDGMNAVGVATHITGPDGVLRYDLSTGIVPILFDTDAPEFAPGFHQGRRIKAAALEPSAHALRYAGAADTTSRGLSRTLRHTDITVECAAEPTSFNRDGGSLTVEYRSDGGGNSYRARLSGNGNWTLYRVAASYETSMVVGVGAQTWNADHFLHRLKIQVIGNVHKAWLNGELQYTYADKLAPITSGTVFALFGKGYNGDVRCLSCRRSDSVTVQDLNPATPGLVRGYGELPAGAVNADSSGSATFTHAHYPLWGFELDGTDYAPAGGLWGGDTLTLNGAASTAGTQAIVEN